jgi:hypothetical protein
MRHQHQLASQAQSLRTIDRVLSGALAACDGHAQHEMLGSYFEAVQELRVSMQRFETFLDARVAPATNVRKPALNGIPSTEA